MRTHVETVLIYFPVLVEFNKKTINEQKIEIKCLIHFFSDPINDGSKGFLLRL